MRERIWDDLGAKAKNMTKINTLYVFFFKKIEWHSHGHMVCVCVNVYKEIISVGHI